MHMKDIAYIMYSFVVATLFPPNTFKLIWSKITALTLISIEASFLNVKGTKCKHRNMCHFHDETTNCIWKLKWILRNIVGVQMQNIISNS